MLCYTILISFLYAGDVKTILHTFISLAYIDKAKNLQNSFGKLEEDIVAGIEQLDVSASTQQLQYCLYRQLYLLQLYFLSGEYECIHSDTSRAR